MRIHEAALLILLVIAAVVAISHYERLPDRMATHFDASGAADGWTSRAVFFGIYGVSLLLAAGPPALLPRYIRRLPESAINLPHKEFWLAPERRDATWAAIEGRLGAIGVAVVTLLVFVLHLIVRANLAPDPGLRPIEIWGPIAAFLIFTAAWTVGLWRRFARPEV